MSPFPLLRLPLVPIKPILDMIDLTDRIHLSMTSRKAYQMVKTAGRLVSLDTFSYEQLKKRNVLEMIDLLFLENYNDSEEFFKKYRQSLRVEISDELKFAFHVFIKSIWIDFDIHVDLKHRQNRYEATIGNWKTGNATFKFWKNKLEGFQMFGDLFKKVSDLQIKIYMGDKEDFFENLRFVVKWINSTHRGSELQHDTHFKSDELMLRGEWLTLDNLFATKCPDIKIYNSNFTYEDFTEYLSQWLAGRFTNLYRLHVKTQNEFDFEQIINKLSNGSVRINEQLVKYIFIRGNESIILKRNDGRAAKILTPVGKVNEFNMRVSTTSIASN